MCVLSPPPTPCRTTQHRAIDRSIPHHRVSENHSFCASADFGAPSPLCLSERQVLERNNLVYPNLIPWCSSICWPFCNHSREHVARTIKRGPGRTSADRCPPCSHHPHVVHPSCILAASFLPATSRSCKTSVLSHTRYCNIGVPFHKKKNIKSQALSPLSQRHSFLSR